MQCSRPGSCRGSGISSTGDRSTGPGFGILLVALALTLAPAGPLRADWDTDALDRAVGPGWPGFAHTRALGPLPASLSFPRTAAFGWTDWLGTGVDPGAAYDVDGSLVALSGPDVSLLAGALPLYVGRVASASPAERGFVPLDDYPGHFYRAPFARVTMSAGDLIEAWSGRFGRTLRDTTVSLELAGGLRRSDGPDGSGSAELERFSARVVTETAGGWRVRARGLHVGLVRVERFPGFDPASFSRSVTASAVDVIVEKSDVSLSLLSGSRWTEDERDGGVRRGDLRLSGATLGLRGGFLPVDTLTLSAGHLSAGGSLYRDGEDVWSLEARAARTVDLRAGDVTVEGGLTRRRGVILPEARVGWTLDSGSRRFRADALITSRHPSSAELLHASIPVPTWGGGTRTIEGAGDLDPEGAVAVLLSALDDAVLSGVGLAVGAARLVDPVRVADGATRPENGEDETTGSAAAWAEVGSRAGAGLRAEVQALAAGDESALHSQMPVPVLAASVEGWFHASFFERDYLGTRWSVRVVHETGLARGAWTDLVDDDTTSVDLMVEGEAGSAVMFVALRDALESASSAAPSRPAPGRRLEAGFHWDFRG